MICSLNQIEQIARKAVRGAGLSWGLADESGKAVSWLHTYGVNGVAVLAGLLDRQDYSNAGTLAPVALSGVWRAGGGTLDPLLVGASLSDCFDRPGDSRIDTDAIAHPILAAGFIGKVAEIEDRVFIVSWPDARLCCRRDGLWIEGEPPAVETETAHFFHCQQHVAQQRADQTAAVSGRRCSPRITEATVESTVWRRLEEYAHRTYVEASATSRLAGAGAGLHDND